MIKLGRVSEKTRGIPTQGFVEDYVTNVSGNRFPKLPG